MSSSVEADDDIELLYEELRRFVLRDEPWREEALCRKEVAAGRLATDDFFPVRGESQVAARECCKRCPVRRECTSYADRSQTEWGIWGGEIRKRGQWENIVPEGYWSELETLVPDVALHREVNEEMEVAVHVNPILMRDRKPAITLRPEGWRGDSPIRCRELIWDGPSRLVQTDENRLEQGARVYIVIDWDHILKIDGEEPRKKWDAALNGG